MTDRAFLRSIIARSLSLDEAVNLRASDAAVPAAEAERLLSRWERLLGEDPIAGGSLFEKRLAVLGIDRAQALQRLVQREWPADAPLPPWAELIEKVLLVHGVARTPSHALEPSAEERDRWGFDVVPVPLFPEALGTFVSVAGARVVQAWESRRVPARLPDALAPCWRYLLVRLSRMAARTLAHEVKRASGEWRLVGDTPELRYQFFMRDILGSREGLGDLLSRYPVLARLLATCAGDLTDALIELGVRARRDAPALARAFNRGARVGEIVDVVPGLSDPHNGARTVCRVTFASGLTLIYKPRSMAVDLIYAGMLARAAGGAGRIISPKVLERGSYGWSERIAERDCKTTSEVSLYLRRQGTQLALIHLLCGQDFHAENFVPHGSQPAAVDLEGIAAPGTHHFGPDAPPRFRPAIGSVLATGMLPQWSAGDEDRILSVNSAISGTAGRPYATRWPAWEGLRTDELRMDYVYPPRPPAASLARLRGKPASPERHVDDVLDGFASGYRALMRQRRAILRGPLGKQLARANTRRLIRDTREYFELQFWSSAPDQLVSGAAYDVALETLWRNVGTLDPAIGSLVDDEKRAIWRGDIPVFRGSAGSRRLRGSSGRSTAVIAEQSSVAQVRRRFEEASAGDMAWQQRLIRSSLAMTFEKRATLKAARQPLRGDDPLRAAAAIGDALGALALRDDLGARWIDLGRVPFSRRVIAPIVTEPWLHSGTAGTALFLAHLARRTGSRRYADLAGEALSYSWHAWQFLQAEHPRTIQLSGMTGAGSLVYAFAECGDLLRRNLWVDRAAAVARSLDPGALRAMTNPDLLGGAAGTVLAILRVYRARPEPALLARAQAAAEAVLAARGSETDGGGWRPPFAHRALLGAAHGASGIVCALAALNRVAASDGLRDARAHGLTFERRHFSAEHGDWPNLQSRSSEPHFMTGWCAGAPGIGLSRLALLECGGPLDSGELTADLDRAIAATARHVGTGQHHLCCGEAGRIMFLVEAGRAGRAGRAGEAGREAARAMVRAYDRDGGWMLHSFKERLILPSLFSGASGVGLALLAAAGAEGASRVLSLS